MPDDYLDDLNRFKRSLDDVLGDAIRKPFSARLGYMDENGQVHVQVPTDRSDLPNRYYFHEAGGTGYQGEANMQPGALASWQIRYNTPIRVRKDALSGEWEIIQLDSRFAQQFFDGVTQEDEVIYYYEKLAPGLLTATFPPSMKAKVIQGAYRLNDVFKYINTMQTVDWGIAPHNAQVPIANLRSRYVLVQVNFETEQLEYKYGEIFPSQLSFSQVLTLDSQTGDYVPHADNGCFRTGYVQLTHGMSEITRRNVIPLQEYLALGGGNGDGSNLDNIVTANGEVVVDPLTGNVVYI